MAPNTSEGKPVTRGITAAANKIIEPVKSRGVATSIFLFKGVENGMGRL
jgi:hypothetical protein